MLSYCPPTTVASTVLSPVCCSGWLLIHWCHLLSPMTMIALCPFFIAVDTQLLFHTVKCTACMHDVYICIMWINPKVTARLQNINSSFHGILVENHVEKVRSRKRQDAAAYLDAIYRSCIKCEMRKCEEWFNLCVLIFSRLLSVSQFILTFISTFYYYSSLLLLINTLTAYIIPAHHVTSSFLLTWDTRKSFCRTNPRHPFWLYCQSLQVVQLVRILCQFWPFLMAAQTYSHKSTCPTLPLVPTVDTNM